MRLSLFPDERFAGTAGFLFSYATGGGAMRRCALVALFCVLFFAGHAAAAQQGVQSKVESAILFRDGLALVTRTVDVPEGTPEVFVRGLPLSTVSDYLEARVLEGAVNVAGSSVVDDGQRKAVLLSLSPPSRCRISVSYLVREAGFEPRYRILALPRYGKVYVETSARMWQSTGEDWRGVRISLSSRSPVVRAAKTVPPPAAQAPIRDFLEAELSEKSGASPRGGSFTTDMLFDPALPGDGSQRSYVVSGVEVPSSFSWVAYPGSDEAVAVARPGLPKDRAYLPGMASVSLDDILVGVLPFPGHEAGAAAAWHLGADPLVMIVRSTGRSAVKGKTRTTRTTVVENKRQAGISVRVGDEVPEHSLDVRPSGKASVSGRRVDWDDVVVEPGKSVSFSVSYVASRPSAGKDGKKGGAK